MFTEITNLLGDTHKKDLQIKEIQLKNQQLSEKLKFRDVKNRRVLAKRKIRWQEKEVQFQKSLTEIRSTLDETRRLWEYDLNEMEFTLQDQKQNRIRMKARNLSRLRDAELEMEEACGLHDTNGQLDKILGEMNEKPSQFGHEGSMKKLDAQSLRRLSMSSTNGSRKSLDTKKSLKRDSPEISRRETSGERVVDLPRMIPPLNLGQNSEKKKQSLVHQDPKKRLQASIRSSSVDPARPLLGSLLSDDDDGGISELSESHDIINTSRSSKLVNNPRKMAQIYEIIEKNNLHELSDSKLIQRCQRRKKVDDDATYMYLEAIMYILESRKENRELEYKKTLSKMTQNTSDAEESASSLTPEVRRQELTAKKGVAAEVSDSYKLPKKVVQPISSSSSSHSHPNPHPPTEYHTNANGPNHHHHHNKPKQVGKLNLLSALVTPRLTSQTGSHITSMSSQGSCSSTPLRLSIHHITNAHLREALEKECNNGKRPSLDQCERIIYGLINSGVMTPRDVSLQDLCAVSCDLALQSPLVSGDEAGIGVGGFGMDAVVETGAGGGDGVVEKHDWKHVDLHDMLAVKSMSTSMSSATDVETKLGQIRADRGIETIVETTNEDISKYGANRSEIDWSRQDQSKDSSQESKREYRIKAFEGENAIKVEDFSINASSATGDLRVEDSESKLTVEDSYTIESNKNLGEGGCETSRGDRPKNGIAVSDSDESREEMYYSSPSWHLRPVNDSNDRSNSSISMSRFKHRSEFFSDQSSSALFSPRDARNELSDISKSFKIPEDQIAELMSSGSINPQLRENFGSNNYDRKSMVDIRDHNVITEATNLSNEEDQNDDDIFFDVDNIVAHKRNSDYNSPRDMVYRGCISSNRTSARDVYSESIFNTSSGTTRTKRKKTPSTSHLRPKGKKKKKRLGSPTGLPSKKSPKILSRIKSAVFENELHSGRSTSRNTGRGHRF